MDLWTPSLELLCLGRLGGDHGPLSTPTAGGGLLFANAFGLGGGMCTLFMLKAHKLVPTLRPHYPTKRGWYSIAEEEATMN